MKRSGKCPKCESTDVIADVKAVDRGHYDSQHSIKLATYKTPDAFLFKGEQSSTVLSWVCRGCGYVELYADAPAQLG
jgi:predicted nucleic-acid-binding Zn-ribbon protein